MASIRILLTVLFQCLSLFAFFYFYLTFDLLFSPLHLSSLALSLLHSIFVSPLSLIKQLALLDIFKVLVSQKQFSQLPCSHFPLLRWPCSYKPSEWTTEAVEQNHSEWSFLMWLLWGSPAVGLVFNQAPGFNSQQADAPLTSTICRSCGGSQNPHALL